MDFLWLFLGLAILIAGGEFLVKGAVAVALKFRISSLVIGMTVVSFGTSAPELLVSLRAAVEGYPEISIGNVIGSNIANLALVLGITAIIFPIPVDRNSIKIDWPAMMVASILFYVFALNYNLEMWEGLIMIALLIGFVYFLIQNSRKKNLQNEEIEVEKQTKLLPAIGFIALGCIGLVFGADWLVKGAVGIARSFEISEHVISVTLIAFGTSVPELATSCVAAFRKEADISIGNLIGSNIFNILCILGITSIVKEVAVSQAVMQSDVFWMLGISTLVFPLMLLKQKISRWKGAILLLAYLAYIFFLLN